MASWTLTGTTTSPTYWKVRAVVTEQSQSVANNTTSLKVSLQLGRDVVSSLIYAYSTTWYINIGASESGDQTLASFEWDPATAGTWKEIASRTVTVAHDADGTKKNLTISAKWFNTHGVTPTESSVSGSVTLTTIPRATTPTTPISVTMGSSATITLPRASSTFTHTLTYTFGGASGTIATGAGASATWSVPLALANQVPNAVSGSGTITCKTYSGSTLIGTKSVSFTAAVPSSVVPTISNVAISEATAGLNAQFGQYVQGKSTLRIQTTRSGAYGSSITKTAVTVAGATLTGADVTTAVITSSGSLTVSITVTDSRGRTASTTRTVSVTAYSAPTATVSGVRAASNGTAAQDGEYLRYNVQYNISPVGNRNTATVRLQYKAASASTWSNVATWTTYSQTITGAVTASAILDGNTTYNLRLMVQDYFGTLYFNTGNIPTAFTLVDYYGADGTGLAFGKVAETGNLFDCNLPAKFRGTLVDGNNAAVDALRHPTRIQPNTGADLDTYLSSGSWYIVSDADAGTIANVPVNRAGYLYVMDSGVKMQVYMTYRGPVYTRFYSSWASTPTWSSWTQQTGADCVIETGKTGIWTYRKYASGIAECWGKTTVSGTFTLARNAWYAITGGSWTTVSFPSGFFNATPECTVTGRLSTNWNYPLGWVGNLSASSLEFLPVLSGQSTSSVTVSYSIHAIGTWK